MATCVPDDKKKTSSRCSYWILNLLDEDGKLSCNRVELMHLISFMFHLKNLTPFLDIVGWSTSSLRRRHELPKVIGSCFLHLFLVTCKF